MRPNGGRPHWKGISATDLECSTRNRWAECQWSETAAWPDKRWLPAPSERTGAMKRHATDIDPQDSFAFEWRSAQALVEAVEVWGWS